MYNIIGFIGLFIAGFFAGKLQSDNAWHRQEEQQQALYNNKINTAIKQNQILLESYTILQSNYHTAMEEKLSVIEQNKQLINRTNTITRRFVQYTTLHSNNMQANNSESIVNPDARVSAVRYGKWIIGLESHDHQCVNQLNILIATINNQGQ